MCRAHLQTDIH